MSDAVCPECNDRTVSDGHFLCETCENALVGSKGGRSRQQRPAPRPMLSSPQFSMASAAVSDEYAYDGAIMLDEKPEKPSEMRLRAFIGRERPRWMQYTLVVAVFALVFSVALVAAIIAAPTSSDTHVLAVKVYFEGISSWWHKLFERLQ